MKNYSAKLISAGYNNYTLLEPYKIIDIMYWRTEISSQIFLFLLFIDYMALRN
jgi:hypothetical protein